MAARMRSHFVHLMLAALLGCAAFACSTDVGDQACTEESIERDRDDDCPYGPPGGPSVQFDEDFCLDRPDIPAELPADCATKYTFTSVFQIFITENTAAPVGGGNCMGANCHGVANIADKPAYLPAMAETDMDGTHESLQAWGLATYGRPYIRSIRAGDDVPGTPEDAWILCNLTGKRGKIMPNVTGFQTETSLQAVRNWVNCGMQAPQPGEAGGAGGAGVGAGGAGDVGGVGGVGGAGGAGEE
jgi:hypothetical protein